MSAAGPVKRADEASWIERRSGVFGFDFSQYRCEYRWIVGIIAKNRCRVLWVGADLFRDDGGLG